MCGLFDVPELVDRVIDYLHDDRSSLRSCVLVAKIWRSSSSFHRFRSITVTTGKELNRLEQCMAANPKLGPYILALTINELARVPSSLTLSRILDLTRAAPSLADLQLENVFWYGESDNANGAGDLAAAGSVRKLSICDGVRSSLGLVRLLQAFPALQRLSIIDAYFTKTNTEHELAAQVLAARHRIPLDELWLEYEELWVELEVFGNRLVPLLANILAEGAPRILRLSNGQPVELLDTLGLCKSIGLGAKELHFHLGRMNGLELGVLHEPIELPHLRVLRIIPGLPDRALSAALSYVFCMFPMAFHAPLLESLEYDFTGHGRWPALEHAATQDVDWERVSRKFRDMRRSNAQLQIRVMLTLDQEDRGCFEVIRVGLQGLVDIGVVQWVAA